MNRDSVDEVAEALAAAQLEASGLTLEITETALMGSVETAIEQLDALKRLGVDLAIDDFGIGYSSLRYLRRLPLDNLKIERSFVDGIGRPGRRAGLCCARSSTWPRSSASTVIAEGIERPEQRERLLELGCDLGQGHLLSEPLARADADALLFRVGPARRTRARRARGRPGATGHHRLRSSRRPIVARIENYSPGRVVVDGVELNRDVIVLPQPGAAQLVAAGRALAGDPGPRGRARRAPGAVDRRLRVLEPAASPIPR